jgi:hypothetical protein
MRGHQKFSKKKEKQVLHCDFCGSPPRKEQANQIITQHNITHTYIYLRVLKPVCNDTQLHPPLSLTTATTSSTTSTSTSTSTNTSF